MGNISKKQDVVYCKNCKYFKQRQLPNSATLFECVKLNDNFSLEEPKLLKHTSCYREKLFNRSKEV